jgi:6-phosphogluconolactonase (cycloisomerase 2 family)
MLRLNRWAPISALVLGVGLSGAAPEEKGDGRLTLIASVPRDELAGVVGATISPDGRFLYASSWQAATVTTFARDPRTGQLEHKQTVADGAVLAGTTAISLSPDGRFAIASAFQARTAVLYRRDAETGELTQADVARDGQGGVRFQWPIDAALSPDGKFAYILDDRGPDEGSQGAVVAFRVAAGRLELVGTDQGKDGCYYGARGLAFHPDGRTLFVACSRAGTLVVANRDEQTGETSVRQVIKDNEEDAHGLAGAMGIAVSPDGRFVYVSAGRFEGDDAVSAFRLTSDGHLAFLQEFLNGEGDLRGFEGGNQIAISPDGRNVYAAATRSGTVASFRRDPAAGKLRYLETLPDGGEGGGLGAAGIGISPDGRFVYVATEDKRAISVFERGSAPVAERPDGH